jgi:hypothetical protein
MIKSLTFPLNTLVTKSYPGGDKQNHESKSGTTGEVKEERVRGERISKNTRNGYL